jgi:hypothetical protein
VQHKPELWAFLEAVMDEVLFEMENGVQTLSRDYLDVP